MHNESSSLVNEGCCIKQATADIKGWPLKILFRCPYLFQKEQEKRWILLWALKCWWKCCANENKTKKKTKQSKTKNQTNSYREVPLYIFWMWFKDHKGELVFVDDHQLEACGFERVFINTRKYQECIAWWCDSSYRDENCRVKIKTEVDCGLTKCTVY